MKNGRAGRFRWLRYLSLLAFALILAWLILIGSMSQAYLYGLTHPACPPSDAEKPPYLPVSLTSTDGLALRGWWLPPHNGAVILLAPGNGGNRDAMLPVADMLARHNYGILTIEARNCSGRATSLGLHETDDLLVMFDFAASQPGVDWIAALGFSAGGTAAIRAAAQNTQLQAVIAEGNYYNLDYEIRNVPAHPFSMEWQIQQAVTLGYWLQTGTWPSQVSPVDDLARIAPRPVLLIAGEFEAANNRTHDQYAAAGHSAQVWIVPGVGHGGYQQAQPAEYERVVIAFLEQARTK